MLSKIIYKLTILTSISICFQNFIFAAEGKIKINETHQTIEGFGASIAWYEDQLATHSKRNEIYNYIFNDLGLDILRLRNVYRNNPNNFAPYFKQVVSKMYEVSPFRPKILISSWSPPANIKSNNSVNGGNNATLKKNSTTGKYMYGEFAKYWVDAINAYKSIGIEPDYISIQNEPSFDPTWESCRLEPTESSTVAGYDKALDSVYFALQNADLHPQILSAEAHGIGYNTFQNYANRFKRNIIDGYAYHLYHGESDNVNDNHNPDLFNPIFLTIARNYSDKPIFQTEYDRGDWFRTVWLINNAMVSGNVSGYLWWELVWGSGGKPLIEMQSSSYVVTKYYWAFRQFSKFIDAGWNRVTTEVDDNGLRISAFINPEGNKLTIVVINVSNNAIEMNLNIQGFNISSGQVIRTSDSENGAITDSSYDGNTKLEYPFHSITTLTFSGNVISRIFDNELANPTGYVLSQNYPNPFNPGTKIQYAISSREFVSLKVYDILGNEVATLVNEELKPGSYSIQFSIVNLQLPSGIYFYQLKTEEFIQTKKMILIK
jgi:glucuronoarabinoxylan endo-1,4-beta-xylanase